MNHAEFAQSILSAIQQQPVSPPEFTPDETKQNNAGRAMTQLICYRLSANGRPPKHLHHTTYQWQGGVITIRNARVVDHHWSSLGPGTLEQLHKQADQAPVAYLFTYWALDDAILHTWALPEDMAYPSLAQLPIGKWGSKTVEIFPGENRIVKCDASPDFGTFNLNVPLSRDEVSRIIEAVKIDETIKQTTIADVKETDRPATLFDAADEEESQQEPAPSFTNSTIAFLRELPQHGEDSEWHEQNKKRYIRVLRDPTSELVEQIRTRFIQHLSPEVAGGTRHISILKKNDYGKGGYHDHYWFAFYDPHAGSKTRSVQLFFRMLGKEGLWRYGFGMGNYCEEYLERFQAALRDNSGTVAKYVRGAPKDTIVRIANDDASDDVSPEEFAKRLEAHGQDTPDTFDSISLIREYPLDTLLNHVDALADEVGKFFVWAWPLFEASVTGKWPTSPKPTDVPAITAETEEYVDEEAPTTIEQLCKATSLRYGFLQDLQEALLTKQQVVLVGPPGTSKTFIAQQFARYFVRERPGQMQGAYHTLYMHANWAYEDFFEGIKPVTNNNVLLFEPKKGFFLEWVTEGLKGHNSSARHVLVLDEINRCDTAAVLGELLQLLEYRGTTVRLLSGRQFVFPRNLYIIGTMNSADRSIGRMDLALRRRFLWLDLHPQPDALREWLGRPGNNPVNFDAAALAECNALLASRGIPTEQHIGHALFMAQQGGMEDELPRDTPLTERQLRRIVRFSVVPYLQELFLAQFGQVDREFCASLEEILLRCTPAAKTSQDSTM